MMTVLSRHWIHARSVIGTIALLFILVVGTGAGLANMADRKAPTAPKNLRVTSFTHYSVSLAWNPSTDNSGFLTYWIQCSNGYKKSVPMSQTSATFTDGINAGGTYWFQVYAVDAAGNRSANSNKATVSLPQDNNPPTVPVVNVTDVGPTHISLSWSATDEGPTVYYWGYRSDWGTFAFFRDTRATSGMVNGLSPNTTYTFQFKARDYLNQMSAMSAPITVTTGPVDPSDTTPPTAPANVWAGSFGDLEFDLYFTRSTDNVTPQEALRYEIFVNGNLSDIIYGNWRTVNYGVPGTNVIEVFAIDAAGNRSQPGTFILELF